MACCLCPGSHIQPDDGPVSKPSKEFFSQWKLTLPDSSETNEVTKSHTPFYIYSDQGITFTCRSNSGTTPNTKYSRCELRELTDGKSASWETGKPHKLSFTFKIISKPAKRPRIVIGQIHDDKDDVIELLANFETGVYEVIHNTSHYGVLVPKLDLDKFYDVSISTSSKGITVTCSSKVVLVSTKKSLKNCYFKVGNYLQSQEKDDEASVFIKHISISN